MARSFEIGATVLATTRSLLADSRRLLAALERDRAVLNHIDDDLMASSRAMIDESRQLLATVQQPASIAKVETLPAADPTATEARVERDRKPAMLSLRICQDGVRFGWTVFSSSSERLGQGTAETEHKARIEAFAAAMTYIERLKHRSRPPDTSLH